MKTILTLLLLFISTSALAGKPSLCNRYGHHAHMAAEARDQGIRSIDLYELMLEAQHPANYVLQVIEAAYVQFANEVPLQVHINSYYWCMDHVPFVNEELKWKRHSTTHS